MYAGREPGIPEHGEPRQGGVYIPLEGGAGGETMRRAVEESWGPALDAFRPEMVFVSAGFDAHVDDDISELAFSDADYHWLTQFVLNIARSHANGRLVSLLEGGYELQSLARCAGGGRGRAPPRTTRSAPATQPPPSPLPGEWPWPGT